MFTVEWDSVVLLLSPGRVSRADVDDVGLSERPSRGVVVDGGLLQSAKLAEQFTNVLVC